MATGKLYENGVGWRDFAATDIPASGVTAATYGDSTHVGQFTVAANGTITAASNVVITGGGGGGGGSEIGYDQITSQVNITSTTEASGTTVIACASHTFDGSPVIMEFFSSDVGNPSATSVNDFVRISLFEGSTQLGRIAEVFLQDLTSGTSMRQTVCSRYRFTPTAGAHTYTITAYVNSTTGGPFVDAGAGGTSTAVPAFCRFTKV